MRNARFSIPVLLGLSINHSHHPRVWLRSVFLDDHWIGSPSEEAYPCSPRGTGAGRCADLPTAKIPEMEAAWLRNMET